MAFSVRGALWVPGVYWGGGGGGGTGVWFIQRQVFLELWSLSLCVTHGACKTLISLGRRIFTNFTYLK